MSQTLHSMPNPFALLMDPQSVFKAIENSERLERLHSRVCRPLDKPVLQLAAPEGEANDGRIDLLDLPGEEI